MKDNQCTCTASEWYFVRVFMRIEEGSGPIDELLTKQTKKGFTSLKYFLLDVLMIVLNAILKVLPKFSMEMPLSYFLVVVILVCIFAAIVILKKLLHH